jgi:hypothetical protein
MAENFVLIYDNRSDCGPRFVGPFSTKRDAEDHADGLATEGWTASYSVVKLASPERDRVGPNWPDGPPISAWSPAPWELS